MVMVAERVYEIWVGDNIHISLTLNVWMAIFIGLQTLGMVYTNFINGVGIIRIQMLTAGITIIANIPLSLFFASTLNMGPPGVVMATCFCLLYGVLFRVIQYLKVINKTATGMWSK